MWIINGVDLEAGRVRQHDDLSYWMSDEEILSALSLDANAGLGPWRVTRDLEVIMKGRQYGPSRKRGSLRANFGPKVGELGFFAENRIGWRSVVNGSWFEDMQGSPGNPCAAARDRGTAVTWCVEGFDRVSHFMMEQYAISHRIAESEMMDALGNPQGNWPEPYFGGAFTSEMARLFEARLGLGLDLAGLEYQVNVASRYGYGWHAGLSGSLSRPGTPWPAGSCTCPRAGPPARSAASWPECRMRHVRR